LVLTLVAVILCHTASAQVTFIQFGETWSYLDDGTDPGTAWRSPTFDDSAWATGLAQFGYGDGDEATVTSFGPNPRVRQVSTYFRKSFEVADVSLIPGVEITFLRDDGAIIYLNGTEIWRDNMPEGEVDSLTLASTPLHAVEERALITFLAGSELLVTGTNVIAVEIHQATMRDGDMSFDLLLKDDPSPTPPVLDRAFIALNGSEPEVTITPQNLHAFDLTSDEPGLVFTVSQVESGRFENEDNPGLEITSFTQEEIADGEIRFVYEPDMFRPAVNAGDLEDHTRLQEISGMVASIQNPGILWATEDSDNPATLIGLRSDGTIRGEWTLTGATNTDWEDTAIATTDGVPRLYIGDFGDNGAARTDLRIYRVTEPLIGAGVGGGAIPAGDIEMIPFQYPEAPAGESGVGSPGIPARRDAESMIVEPGTGDIYIFSKRETVCRIFRLAHQTSYVGTQTLEYLGDMPAIIRDSIATTTAADISRDGLELAFRNYRHIFRYKRPDLSVSLATLLTGTEMVEVEPAPFVEEPICEAICFSASGDGFYTIGEITGGLTKIPLFYYERLPPEPAPAFQVTVTDGEFVTDPQVATVLFQAPPREIWRYQHFDMAGLGDESISGDLADPDADGRPNIIEYALRANPHTSDAAPEFQLERVQQNDLPFLSASYQKDLAKTDVEFQLQMSSNLVAWSDLDDEFHGEQDGIQTRRALIPIGSEPQIYVRLIVSSVAVP